MGRDNAPKIRSIVASDGVDVFKDSELHNRCISRLGEGCWPFATAVSTAIAFQSRTGSAFATAGPNSRAAIKMYRTKALLPAPPCILFIVFCPNFQCLRSVVSGIFAVEGMVVHIEAHVGALCFVSR